MYCIGIPDKELYLTILCDYEFGCCAIYKNISMIIINKDDFTIYNSLDKAKADLNEIKLNKDSITFADSCFCEEISNSENEFDVEELEICRVLINKNDISPLNKSENS